jgi:hypothetical protein
MSQALPQGSGFAHIRVFPHIFLCHCNGKVRKTVAVMLDEA